MPGEKVIGVITQKNPDVEDPQYGDLHTVGVILMVTGATGLALGIFLMLRARSAGYPPSGPVA